jgi:hypothetical protein
MRRKAVNGCSVPHTDAPKSQTRQEAGPESAGLVDNKIKKPGRRDSDAAEAGHFLHGGITMKRLLIAAATAAALFASATSAETVPLFDATPVTAVAFGTDFSKRFVFKTSDPVTVYCVGDQTAYVKDTTGGPPIVDNYMTAGDDLKSICEGGSGIQSQGIAIAGTHCFVGGNGSITGGDIRNTFNAAGVTAPVSLFDGENNLTFKLWDYGVVYGNTPLELVLPEACSTFGCWEDETAWSDGSRYVTRGNWATYTEVDEDPKTVTLYAAQNLEAGTVTFEVNQSGATDITITLNDGFRFALDEDNEPVFENLKIQGYDFAPSGNPSPGEFAFKSTESGKSATVTVDSYQYYGVHVDVEVGVDCPVVNLLYDGGFDLTCAAAGQWFNPTSADITTADTNWYAWRALKSWACALENNEWYAAQDPSLHEPVSADLTQAIKQAIDGSVVPINSTLRLSFDYRSANAGIQVQVYGLAAGQSWQPFPVGGAPLGTCTGCALLLDTTALASADWTAFSQTFDVSADYVAIAIGVSMGGPTQTPFRGLDNVVLTIE